MMHPECAVRAIVLNPKGEMLLIRSVGKWQGQYVCPGGRVELYECLEDAVKRELQEEVGLEVEVGLFIGLQEDIAPPSVNGVSRHLIFLDFLCYCNNMDVRIDGVEAQEYLWVVPTEALALETTESTREMIRNFMILVMHNGVHI
jgi:8-oxo-dGTP diphosphatase